MKEDAQYAQPLLRQPILPAQHADRARAFYRDVLGLDLLTGPKDDPMVFGAASGSSIALSEMPDRVPPPYPVVSFMVNGIEEIVDSLKARGATFLRPTPASFAGVVGRVVGDAMDFGQAKSAFLKDSEGNVIALNEFIG